MFTLLSWIVYGAIVGWIAKSVTETSLTFWQTVGLGVAGSYVGGAISWFLNGGTDFSPAGVILGIIGAVVAIIGYRKFFAQW